MAEFCVWRARLVKEKEWCAGHNSGAGKTERRPQHAGWLQTTCVRARACEKESGEQRVGGRQEKEGASRSRTYRSLLEFLRGLVPPPLDFSHCKHSHGNDG